METKDAPNTIGSVDHEALKIALPVFLDFIDPYNDDEVAQIDATSILNAIAARIPDVEPEMIVDLFRRSAALHSIFDHLLSEPIAQRGFAPSSWEEVIGLIPEAAYRAAATISLSQSKMEPHGLVFAKIDWVAFSDAMAKQAAN